MRNKYSVIVPVRNGALTIKECLRSIKNQSFKPFEIIVVNNGSTDETKDILSREKDIQVVNTKESGRSFARNRGADLAKGEYLVFVDADVTLEKNWLLNVDRYLRRYDLDGVATSVIPAMEVEGPVDIYRDTFARWKSHGTYLSIMKHHGPMPVINTAACVIRKKAFIEAGKFRVDLERNEDFEFSFKLFSSGYFIDGTTDARAYVRYVEQDSRLPRELTYLKRAFEVHLKIPIRTGPRRPLNWSLLKKIYNERKRIDAVFFATAAEVISVAGYSTGKLFYPQNQIRPGRPIGRQTLKYSFFYQGRFHQLLSPTNVLRVDNDLYLMKGFTPQKLSVKEAKALESIGKLPTTEEQAKTLFNLGVYRNTENDQSRTVV